MKNYQYVVDFLMEEGIEFHEISSWFFYTYEGHQFVVNKNDPALFSIMIRCDTSDYCLEDVLEKCNELNIGSPYIKFVVIQEMCFGLYQCDSFPPSYKIYYIMKGLISSHEYLIEQLEEISSN